MGREKYPHHHWSQSNVLESGPLLWLLSPRSPSFDVIISNPDFECGMAFLYVALLVLSKSTNPNARAIFLLPTDYFEGSDARARVYRIHKLVFFCNFKLILGIGCS